MAIVVPELLLFGSSPGGIRLIPSLLHRYLVQCYAYRVLDGVSRP